MKDAKGNIGTIALKVHFIDCSTKHARGYDSPRLETAMLIVPGQPVADGVLATVYVALDRTEWCKFGPAAAVAMTLIPTDEDGTLTIPVAENTPTTPLADNAPNADNAKDNKPQAGADKPATDGSGVVIKDDDNWTWDPKEKVYVSKKDPKVKHPVPTSVKKGQMWDPEGDPDGLSPIEPETSGNSRTYIDPNTHKIITREYVDQNGLVYERDDNFDQGGDPQLVRTYDHITGKLQERRTTDAKTGIRTTEKFDQDGKLTNVSTFKDNQQLTNEDYQDGKLVKRTTYWPARIRCKRSKRISTATSRKRRPTTRSCRARYAAGQDRNRAAAATGHDSGLRQDNLHRHRQRDGVAVGDSGAALSEARLAGNRNQGGARHRLR